MSKITVTPPILCVSAYEIIETHAAAWLIRCWGRDGETEQDMGLKLAPALGGDTTTANAHSDICTHLADKNAAPYIPSPTPDQLRATLKFRASARRWEVETGGAPVPNTDLHIDTDDRTKTLIAGVLMMSQLDETFTTRWKAADGSWHILDGQMIALLSVTISRHVDRCFAREGELHDLIEAAPDRAALESLRPVIDQFWP